jgi:hypothetical protein
MKNLEADAFDPASFGQNLSDLDARALLSYLPPKGFGFAR